MEHSDGYRDSERDHDRHKDRTPSPHRSRSKRKTKSSNHKTTTFHLEEPRSPPVRTALTFSSDDEIVTNGEDLTRPKTFQPPPPPVLEHTDDWRTGYSTTLFSSHTAGYRDDSSRMPDNREVEMRIKTMEAKFEEEKLRLQQKHDSTVQKVWSSKCLLLGLFPLQIHFFSHNSLVVMTSNIL